MINNMKTGYSEADKRRIKIWRLMYRITETGHTVSITKEKFLNTYPPLFGNPPDMSKVMWPGDFFGCAVPEGSGRQRMRTTSAVRENMKRPVDKT